MNSTIATTTGVIIAQQRHIDISDADDIYDGEATATIFHADDVDVVAGTDEGDPWVDLVIGGDDSEDVEAVLVTMSAFEARALAAELITAADKAAAVVAAAEHVATFTPARRAPQLVGVVCSCGASSYGESLRDTAELEHEAHAAGGGGFRPADADGAAAIAASRLARVSA